MNKITILVVSKQMMLRETWSQMLNTNHQMEVVDICKTGASATLCCQKYYPDIVLYDINSLMNDLETGAAILKISKNTHILAISQYTHSTIVRKTMSAGFAGYLTKNSSCTELFEAIKQLADGRKYICREIKNLMVDELITDQKTLPSLTPRELEIIQLLCSGRTSKEIAWHLKLSIKTVEVHRYNILHKLELKNSAALMNYMHRNIPV